MKQVAIVLLTILAGCSERKALSEHELANYMMNIDNGLRKQKRANDIDIEVIYRPTDLVIAQQLRGSTDAGERNASRDAFDSLSYFVFRLSRAGEEVEKAFAYDNERFAEVIKYLSSSIGRNIYLVNGVDTTRALDAVYTRMFGASTATSVMAVFSTDVKALDHDVILCLEDTELGLGQNHFHFDIQDIKKTPTLNLN